MKYIICVLVGEFVFIFGVIYFSNIRKEKKEGDMCVHVI